MGVQEIIAFIRGWVEKFIDEWFSELAKVWNDFVRRLDSIWEFEVSDFILYLLFPPLFGADNAVRLLDTWDAWKEFVQDATLVGRRVAADVVDDAIPVPDEWKTRVVRADQMLRFMVREAIEFGTDIIDADIPAILDLAKQLGKFEKVKEAVGWLQGALERAADKAGKGASAGKGLVAGVVLDTVVMAFGQFASIALVIWAANILIRAHGPEGKDILSERALSQDNRRVWRSGRRRAREDDR